MGRWRILVPTVLTRCMLALLLALLAAALWLGAGQSSETKKAFAAAVVALLAAWKVLPWLSRQLSRLGTIWVWVALTLLCLVVKGAWVVLVQVPMEGDYATFWGYATALAQEPVLDGGRYMALFPHIFGYASFLSWFIRLLGQPPLLAQWLNVLLTICSGSLLFLLAKRWWSLPGGVCAYLLWIVCPSQTMYNSLVLSEPLYTTLLLLFLYLITGPLPGVFWKAALLGAGAGLVLRWFNGIRPIAAVLIIALVLWRFLLAPDGLKESKARWQWLPLMAALAAVYLLTGPLWQGHIAARIGEEPSSTPGYSILVGFNAQSRGCWNQEDSNLLNEYSSQPGVTAQQAQEYAMEAAKERITSGQVDFLQLFREKLRGFLGADSACVSYSSQVVRHVLWFARACNAYYYFLLLLAGGGGVMLWRRGDRSAVLLLPLYVLGLTSAQMLVEVAGRYHYSILPVLMLLGQGLLFPPHPGREKKLQKNQETA